jgi:hypothetical protein
MMGRIYEIIFWSINDNGLLKVRVDTDSDDPESFSQWEGRLLLDDESEWPDDEQDQISFLQQCQGINWEPYSDFF